jgi:uncharacterized protein (TIGR04255 family)
LPFDNLASLVSFILIMEEKEGIIVLDRVVFTVYYNKLQFTTGLDSRIKDFCIKITNAPLTVFNNPVVSITSNNKPETTFQQQWISKGDKYEINIHGEFIQIIAYKYKHHDEFYFIIETFLSLFNKLYEPIKLRYSLRYINLINIKQGDSFDFKGIIIDELLEPTQIFKSDGLTRSLGTMGFLKDDITINFIYGYYNSEYPNRISRREFVLDYECYINTINQEASAASHLEKIRAVANELYNKSIAKL